MGGWGDNLTQEALSLTRRTQLPPVQRSILAFSFKEEVTYERRTYSVSQVCDVRDNPLLSLR